MQRALAPLLLAILVSFPLHAAKIPISGRVVDPGGKAVAGVKVFLAPVPTATERASLELAGKTAKQAVTAAPRSNRSASSHASSRRWQRLWPSRTYPPIACRGSWLHSDSPWRSLLRRGYEQAQ